MISISKLYCGQSTSGDSLRYARTAHRRPVVVWNCTRRCNLRCLHCYSASENRAYPNELTNEQAKDVIKDLAEFEIPVLLFSGGEPLMRRDLFGLASIASNYGTKCALSTNGTLITKAMAKKIKDAGFSYVGISLDGIEDTNDVFRGMDGAYAAALRGIRNCLTEGIKTGIRFTITKQTHGDLPGIFRLAEEEKVSRLCLYHLVYVGRSGDSANNDVSTQETRMLMNYVLEMSRRMQECDRNTEILTVDNHADGAYLYLRLMEEGSGLASSSLSLLKINGGNSSGLGIGCIDSNGFVHPDQFWRNHSLGNVKEQRFSEIWNNGSEPLLNTLRNRKSFLKGRCSECKFLDICNGNLRARAEAVYGDAWAPDPACYLTDEEIGVA